MMQVTQRQGAQGCHRGWPRRCLPQHPARAQGFLANLAPEEPVEKTIQRLFGSRPIRDKDGRSVDRNYRFVNRVIINYLGRDIAEFDTATSIGENPSFGFAFRATEAGALRVTFFDSHGSRFEGAAQVKLA
jgi:hypothetical protein